jgi:hypothetical protein
MLAALVVSASAAPATAWSSTGGNANAGDVWVDNVGQPSGPGHEMDPHLGCQDINLWGSGLADASGTFTIDGWAPSGSQDVDYGPAPWSYNLSRGGTQVIAVIDVRALINAAAWNGDVPLRTHGYHFKLQFSQDPQKHKTFWVNCPPPPPPAPPTGTTKTGSPTGSGDTPHHRRVAHARRHHRLRKPKRHHRARHRHDARHSTTTHAVFTG